MSQQQQQQASARYRMNPNRPIPIAMPNTAAWMAHDRSATGDSVTGMLDMLSFNPVNYPLQQQQQCASNAIAYATQAAALRQALLRDRQVRQQQQMRQQQQLLHQMQLQQQLQQQMSPLDGMDPFMQWIMEHENENVVGLSSTALPVYTIQPTNVPVTATPSLGHPGPMSAADTAALAELMLQQHDTNNDMLADTSSASVPMNGRMSLPLAGNSLVPDRSSDWQFPLAKQAHHPVSELQAQMAGAGLAPPDTLGPSMDFLNMQAAVEVKPPMTVQEQQEMGPTQLRHDMPPPSTVPMRSRSLYQSLPLLETDRPSEDMRMALSDETAAHLRDMMPTAMDADASPQLQIKVQPPPTAQMGTEIQDVTPSDYACLSLFEEAGLSTVTEEPSHEMTPPTSPVFTATTTTTASTLPLNPSSLTVPVDRGRISTDISISAGSLASPFDRLRFPSHLSSSSHHGQDHGHERDRSHSEPYPRTDENGNPLDARTLRRIRNTDSARRCRQRNKEKMAHLEERAQLLEAELNRMRTENARLQSQFCAVNALAQLREQQLVRANQIFMAHGLEPMNLS